jgi:hypothetical protein
MEVWWLKSQGFVKYNYPAHYCLSRRCP